MMQRARAALLTLSLAALLAAPLAEAARMGKGRSAGMQRSAPTQPMTIPARPAAPAPQPAQPSRGPGVGTAIAAGAAGAAAGYMLGNAMNDNHASAPSGQPAGSGFPWGTIALMALLVGGALMFFRRSQRQATAAMAGGAARMAAPTQFPPIPKVGGSGAPYGGGMAAQPAVQQGRLTDGTEAAHFLRQAKATFLHLQSLNTPESLEEVRRYMTPELFEDLRADIASNSAVADFPQLDCQLLESVQENGRHVASVRFTGMVSEEVNAPTVPFTETWHYVKDANGSSRWLLAGIQQA